MRLTLTALLALALAGTAFAQVTRVTREETEQVRERGTTRLIQLPSDTLVRITVLDSIDSRNWKEGDTFPYEVAQDVMVDRQLAIPAGTKGAGVITRARKAGSFGRAGKIEMSFGTIPVGGRNIDLVLSDKAREGNEKEHLAAGASLAGLAVAGPVGLVGGLFVHGKNISIPAGSELYVATQGRIELTPVLRRVR